MKSNPVRMSLRLAGAFATTILAGACATAPIPYKAPVQVTPPSGRVAVTQSLMIFDASGSQSAQFADGKSTLESVVAAMPNGSYDAGHVHFGGGQREASGISAFDRNGLASVARDAEFLEGSSPLYSIFENEAAEALSGGSGRAAVLIISDGLATDYAGRADEDQRTLEAARTLASERGDVCFHTIQSGDAAAGATLLRSIADITSCGSFRNASSLGTASALQQFSSSVYLGGAPAPSRPAPRATPVAAALPDTDGDGVVDPRDDCPNTLKAARVDARGCWTLHDLRFAVNGAGIEMGFTSSLREDIEVLKANPDVRIRVDGHTDSDGSAAYNQGLSERRASSVRDYLVSEGLEADRFTVKGFGESAPIVPNDSADNKRRNRRVELTIIN